MERNLGRPLSIHFGGSKPVLGALSQYMQTVVLADSEARGLQAVPMVGLVPVLPLSDRSKQVMPYINLRQKGRKPD